jgi:hypothetical protein
MMLGTTATGAGAGAAAIVTNAAKGSANKTLLNMILPERCSRLLAMKR